jgi:1-acyl-sn-glycerol-3-phosphate acyltransferase
MRKQYGDLEWCRSSYETFQALRNLGASVEVSGMEHLRSVNGPVVLIGNHMSTLETFALPFMVCPHRAVTFVVKRSLVDYPVFKHIMRARNPVVVGRESPKEDLRVMMEEGGRRLRAGSSVIVFPQTTRSAVFDPSQFNSIGVKLAKKEGVPVIPIALKTDAWGTGTLIKDFGRIDPSRPVHFAFGPPMQISGNGAEQQAAIVAFIQSHLSRWEAEGAGRGGVAAPLP